MINDPADIEWLYTGLSTGSGQEIVGLSKTDYETVRAALESDTRRAKRAEAEAEDYNKRVWELIAERDALRAQLDAAQVAAERRADDLKTELDWLRDQVERVGYQNPNSPPPVGKWYWDQEYNGGWVRQD